MSQTHPASAAETTVRNLPVPAGYMVVDRRAVPVDRERAELIRYERADGRNTGIGGEHFSTVVASNGLLKGFVRMDLDLAGRALPSQEECRVIALSFLQEAAPDLLRAYRISWIEPHDELLQTNRNGHAGNVMLTGMKVKAQNTADGRWFWVIVGAGRKIMVFERDIVWITFPGHRQTEKWLHDAWLVEKGQAGRAS